MGLDLPALDDRTYEDLLEQAKKLIPAYSDEWTDFNPHDPGITILELLAWLTETHTYQLDQITDDHRKKYLRLIDHQPRPPTPATAPLKITSPAALSGHQLPAGTTLTVTDGTNELSRFETDYDLYLTTTAIDRVYTITTGDMQNHTEANRTANMFYLPFGERPTDTTALYLGFDADPFAEADRLTLSVGFHTANLPEPTPPRDPDNSQPFTPSVELTWEYYTPATSQWEPLTVVRDGTSRFSHSGGIECKRVGSAVGSTTANRESPVNKLDDSRHWVRCRLDTPAYEIPPQFNYIQTNSVTASHAVSVTDEQLRRDGDTNAQHRTPYLDGQQFVFANRPVQSATVNVNGKHCTEVPDFDASGPTDRHYVLDNEQGTITFGDGSNGWMPPADAVVTASYVYGGGTAGNVSATAGWVLTESPATLPEGVTVSDIEATPLGPGRGGTDTESVTDALQRARRDLRRPARAVTEDDYHTLAAETPGLRIGRTAAWVAGSNATVIVVPYTPAAVDSPEPSAAFLQRVKSHLQERTLLTDHVTVSGPRYVRLEITVSGAIRHRYGQSGYTSAITDAIESYLHPLYGYTGTGWPFGRALESEELQAEIAAVDAVDYVSEIRFTAHGGTTVDRQRVTIDEMALFAVEDVSVEMTISEEGH